MKLWWRPAFSIAASCVDCIANLRSQYSRRISRANLFILTHTKFATLHDMVLWSDMILHLRQLGFIKRNKFLVLSVSFIKIILQDLIVRPLLTDITFFVIKTINCYTLLQHFPSDDWPKKLCHIIRTAHGVRRHITLFLRGSHKEKGWRLGTADLLYYKNKTARLVRIETDAQNTICPGFFQI